MLSCGALNVDVGVLYKSLQGGAYEPLVNVGFRGEHLATTS